MNKKRPTADQAKVDNRLYGKLYSLSLLRRATGEKDFTIRNWLNRYFKGYGRHSESGRLRFTILECQHILVFSDLVSKMCIRPELARHIVKETQARWTEMWKNDDIGKSPSPERVYLKLENISRDNFDCKRVTRAQIFESFRDSTADQPYQRAQLLIPVESYFVDTMFRMAEVSDKQKSLDLLKKAISDDGSIRKEDVKALLRSLSVGKLKKKRGGAPDEFI